MIYHRLRHILLFLPLAFLPGRLQAQLLAAHVDVAVLATQTYNIGVEMTVGHRQTLGLAVLGNYHPWISRDMRLVALQPEWRYYYSGRPMMSNFIGVSGLAARYNFTRSGNRYQGDAVGAGVSFGHVLPLTNRLNLDFHASVGVWVYHEYQKSTHVIVLPTKLGISLSYILK